MRTRRNTATKQPAYENVTADVMPTAPATSITGPPLQPFLPAVCVDAEWVPEMRRMLEDIEENEQFVVTQQVRHQIRQQVWEDFQRVVQAKDHQILELQQHLHRARQDMATLQHLLCSQHKIISYTHGTESSPHGQLSLQH